jgi:hypothetical protein
VYLRFRRLIPFAIAHALMDAMSAFVDVLSYDARGELRRQTLTNTAAPIP